MTAIETTKSENSQTSESQVIKIMILINYLKLNTITFYYKFFFS